MFPKYWLFSLSRLIIHRKWKIFSRTDYKMPTTNLFAIQVKKKSDLYPVTGRTLAMPFFAPPQTGMLSGQRLFPAIHSSHSKWHTSHNRKFLKSYKFRENSKTISLHIYKAEVNSCSQKHKVSQVDCTVTAGQRFFSHEDISSRGARLQSLSLLNQHSLKISTLLHQQVPERTDSPLLPLSTTKPCSLALP